MLKITNIIAKGDTYKDTKTDLIWVHQEPSEKNAYTDTFICYKYEEESLVIVTTKQNIHTGEITILKQSYAWLQEKNELFGNHYTNAHQPDETWQTKDPTELPKGYEDMVYQFN